MIVEFDSKSLAGALSVSGKLIRKPAISRIVAEKKKIYLQQISENGAVYEQIIEGSVEKSGDLAIATDILENMLKTRSAKIKVKVKSSLSFTAGKTTGSEIPLSVPFENPIYSLEKRTKNSIDIPSKIQSRLLILLSHCAFNSFFEKTLPIVITSKGKKVIAGCGDVTLSVLGELNVPVKNLEDISVPAAYAQMFRDIPGTDFSLSIDKSNITITTNVVFLRLPNLQTEVVGSIDDMLKVASLESKVTAKASTEELKDALESLMITFEKNTPVLFKMGKKTTELEYKTSRGVVKRVVNISASKPINFLLDAETLLSRLSKASGEVDISISAQTATFRYSLGKSMNASFTCVNKIEK